MLLLQLLLPGELEVANYMTFQFQVYLYLINNNCLKNDLKTSTKLNK